MALGLGDNANTFQHGLETKIFSSLSQFAIDRYNLLLHIELSHEINVQWSQSWVYQNTWYLIRSDKKETSQRLQCEVNRAWNINITSTMSCYFMLIIKVGLDLSHPIEKVVVNTRLGYQGENSHGLPMIKKACLRLLAMVGDNHFQNVDKVC